MNDKTKEHIEQLYNIVKSQNKYILSLEIALSKKPKIKYIAIEDEHYKENSVKLFNNYQEEIVNKDKQIANKDREIELLKQEIECLKNGYIHTPIYV